MKKMLSTRSRASQADFQHVWDHLPSIIGKHEIDSLLEESIQECRKVTSGLKVAYGWSGGKDSWAVQAICAEVGIKAGVLSIVGPLEFPANFEYWETHKLPGIELLSRDDLTLAWLAEKEQRHQRYLFPTRSRDGYFWTKNGTHWGQKIYYQKHNLDMMIYGRTRGDNNYIGTGGIHTNRAGLTQYCPIRQWPLEAILGYCYHYHVPMMPIYGYPNGWKSGTGPWAGRQGFASKLDAWRATYAIDPSLVKQGAVYFQDAWEVLLQA